MLGRFGGTKGEGVLITNDCVYAVVGIAIVYVHGMTQHDNLVHGQNVKLITYSGFAY